MLQDFRSIRRLRAFNRLAQIILAVALIAGINFIAARHYLRFDITEAQRYSLSPETEAYLKQVEKPVDIFIPVIPSDEIASIYEDIRDLEREYLAVANRFGVDLTFHYVEVYKQTSRLRTLVQQFGENWGNKILVTSGDRTSQVVLFPTDAPGEKRSDVYEMKDGKPTAFLGERAFTNAIIEVSQAEAPVIYFTVGHGEMMLGSGDRQEGLSALRQLLIERNFDVRELNLGSDREVPDDASLIIIAAPQIEFPDYEEEVLRSYLEDRGGSIIAAIEPFRLHGLDDLFFDWGIRSDDRLIIENDPDNLAPGGDLIVNRFTPDHPITQVFHDRGLGLLWGASRPVRQDPGAPIDERLDVTALLGSSQQSWAERNYRTERPPEQNRGDLTGPVPLAASAERKVGADLGLDLSGGKLVVFGNAGFMANSRLTALGNRFLILNAVGWSLDRRDMIDIPPKPLDSFQIVISDSAMTRILLAFGAVPGGVAFFGLLVWLLRKR
jgi:ABC-type uncharacterized transport system involved in gliding motility auxiliary subunit